jgi:hypothetical protein
MTRRILFADNNLKFLKTRARFLENAGFDVHRSIR